MFFELRGREEEERNNLKGAVDASFEFRQLVGFKGKSQHYSILNWCVLYYCILKSNVS
jgi:hypothetical protein